MVVFPGVFFALRWAMLRIAPVGQPWPPRETPPIIELLPEAGARQALYAELRARLLGRANLYATLAITVVVNVLDMWSVVRPYTGFGGASADWTAMFLVDDGIGRAANLGLLVSAYAVQCAVVFIGVLAIVLILQHNLFFIRHVYQRRWVSAGEEARFFQINVRDVNRCFGFRVANRAFNTQVQALMIAGLAMFLSRYAHSVGQAGSVTQLIKWPPQLPDLSFPVAGQWLMALLWLVALGTVALPSFVKLLPQLPIGGRRRGDLSISNYLREFFSDAAWPKDAAGRDESDTLVAARFACNSFWPTGDNRARVLFFFSYWIFFVILLPPSARELTHLLLHLLVSAVLAYLVLRLTFAALRWSLRYVDELLVTAGGDVASGLDTSDPRADRLCDRGVFISYRRRDSAAYARALHERLQEHFRAERIFMDIADIAPGDNFVHAIDTALSQVDAVVVVIGDRWLSVTDAAGRPRIADPDDMVHIEVATALQRGKRILPVTVGGARMPQAAELPPPLAPLGELHAVDLSDTRWAYDVGQLIAAIKTG